MRNTGIEEATKAALAVDGRLAVPAMCKRADFWDLWHEQGADAVQAAIEAAAPVEDQQRGQKEALATVQVGIRLEVIRAADIKMEAIGWIWPGWLAAGKMHIFAGSPGTGKTTIALTLAATLTNGGKWPDGTPSHHGEVLVWSGEDDPADTLVPRVAAAGANLNFVHFVGGVRAGEARRPFDPAVDMPILAQYLREHPGVKLLVVDPVVSAVGGDSHKNTEVRRSLQPLVDLGAATGCAILGISHFSKGTSGRDPLERVTGSIAFGAVARIVWASAKVADDPEGRRLFARTKSNIGPDGGGFHYLLETTELANSPGVVTSKITWAGAVEGSARELLGTAEETEGAGEKGALADAKEFLAEMLKDGPLAVRYIFDQAREVELSQKTIRRAKDALGVEAKKIGMRSGWTWALPSKVPKNAEDAQRKNVGIFGESWPPSQVEDTDVGEIVEVTI